MLEFKGLSSRKMEIYCEQKHGIGFADGRGKGGEKERQMTYTDKFIPFSVSSHKAFDYAFSPWQVQCVFS